MSGNTAKTVPRRNTKNIGFNAEEYKEVVKAAKKAGMYPRQYIMYKIRYPDGGIS